MQLSETIYEYEPPVTSANRTMETVEAQHNSTHNPEVAGSNPVPATKKPGQRMLPLAWFRFRWVRSVFITRRFVDFLAALRLPRTALSTIVATSGGR